MNWNDLRIFLTVARTGSLTAAGAKLGINQSTVSRRLAAIEKDLGARLINRRTGEAMLTTVGEELLSKAEGIAQQFSLIEEQVGGRDSALSGRLRVTCTDSFFNFYVARHAAKFAKLHPEIDLEILTDYQHRSLAGREADVGIRVTPRPPETLVGRRIFCFPLGVYANREFVARLDGIPDPAALPWIGWNHEPYNRLMITNHYPNAIIRHRGDTQVDITTMVREGLGVGVLGCFFADPDSRLRRVYDDLITDSDMDLWVLWHPDLKNVSRVRKFTSFMAEAFLADADLFNGQRSFPHHGRHTKRKVKK